jgi:hypothetical protein
LGVGEFERLGSVSGRSFSDAVEGLAVEEHVLERVGFLAEIPVDMVVSREKNQGIHEFHRVKLNECI